MDQSVTGVGNILCRIKSMYEFYSTREVSEILRLDVKTVRAAIARGDIRAVRFGEMTSYRIPAAEVHRWAGTQELTPPQKAALKNDLNRREHAVAQGEQQFGASSNA